MLSGHGEQGNPGFAQNLLGVVELVVARQLGDVAGVDDEIGPLRLGQHLGDGFAEGGAGVGIGRLGKADVAVAQLEEGEPGVRFARRAHCAVQIERGRHASGDGKQRPRACPRHAFQKAAPAVPLVVDHALSFQQVEHKTDAALRLFPRR